jgi:putative ABC transport system permease protein
VQPGQTLGGADARLPQEAEALVGRIGPVEAVSAVAAVDATVLRNDRVDENATGGIGVMAARGNLLTVLRGTVAQGRFLDRASERYPTVVLGAVAAERLGIATLRRGITVQVGGEPFTVVGILDPLPLAPTSTAPR